MDLEPISSQTNPGWPDPAPPAPRKGNWGGRRPGAGAPKGNLNGWRHGKNSRYHKQLAHFVSLIPEAEEAMIRIAQRRRKKDRQVQAGAAELLAEACRRLGELVLEYTPSPAERERGQGGEGQSNQLESNQVLAAQLNQLRALFEEIRATQSSERAQ
jgi:hypothetical protein